jgi:hypothetical protein
MYKLLFCPGNDLPDASKRPAPGWKELITHFEYGFIILIFRVSSVIDGG